jgi:hypothetical protein
MKYSEYRFISNELDKVQKYAEQLRGETLRFMAWLLDALPPQSEFTFVEIGTKDGGNFVFMGNCLLKRHEDVFGIAVDRDEHLNDIRSLSPRFQFEFIQGNSQHMVTAEAVRHEVDHVDLLFIDGGYDEPILTGDCLNYINMVRPNGVVAFHDYHDMMRRNYGILKTLEKCYKMHKWSVGKGKKIAGIGAFVYSERD